MAERFQTPNWEGFDGSGNPVSGAKLSFSAAGNSTSLDTFSDETLTVQNSNPVIADSAGRFGDIWLRPLDYKVVLTDRDDVVIWTADPVHGIHHVTLGTGTKSVGDNYQIVQADNGNVMLIAGSNVNGTNFHVDLPAAASLTLPFSVGVKMVSGTGGESRILSPDTIDGTATPPSPGIHVNLNESKWFVTDGVAWFQVAAVQAHAVVGLVALNTNFTIIEENDGADIMFDTSTFTRTCTLPKSLTVSGGFSVVISKIDSGSGKVVVVPQGSDLIDGLYSSVELPQQTSDVWLVNSGLDTGNFKGWFVLSHSGAALFVV